MMGRPAALIAVLALAVLGASASAAAAPQITLRALFVPVKGFPGSGNMLGAGASLLTDLSISGDEYGRRPPPLIGLNLFLPRGTVLYSVGFGKCPEATILEAKAPDLCPAGSAAGPAGELLAAIPSGSSSVQEQAVLLPFFAPGGGVELYATAYQPATLELAASGSFLNLSGGEGFGPELKLNLPEYRAAPAQAPYVSIERMSFKIGAAYRSIPTHKAVYSMRVPKTCPSAGFPARAELTFAEGGDPDRPQTVTVPVRMACPPKRRPPSTPKIIAPEPPAPGTRMAGSLGVLSAPPSTQCISGRALSIEVHHVAGFHYRRLSIYVDGARAQVLTGGLIGGRLEVRGLPNADYSVKVVVSMQHHRRVTAVRNYRTCPQQLAQA